MKIAFVENSLSIRGSTVALYDYAHYAETLLSHNSIIITRSFDLNRPDSCPEVYKKFEERFPVFYYQQESEISNILDQQKPDVLYVLKYGIRDGLVSNTVPTLVHAIFDPRDPHGDDFCVISPWLNIAFGTNFPVIPHIVTLPSTTLDLRESLGIPSTATVFGRHGGYKEFDHPVAQNTVRRLAQSHPDIYFVFLNTEPFMESRRNVIFLEKSTSPFYKRQFINTADAMLYARSRGETFGLAIAEFSFCNKPIFAPAQASEQMHRLILKDRAQWYTDESDLENKLLTFDRISSASEDWNMYKEYSPEKVMGIFQERLTTLVSKMPPERLCYVTAFLDLQRDTWQHFKRNTDTYFQEFQPMLDMFVDHPDASNYDLVVFIDSKHFHRLPKVLPPNIIVKEIDEVYLQTHSPLWQRLDKEKSIMESETYRNIVRHRLHHPEHHNPKYTMINHCKVDFLHLAMDMVPEATHFAWVDFGYCKLQENIPRNFLDLNKVDKTKVNYTLINPINPIQDREVIYTLQHAPEKVGGFFFCGSKESLLKYREMYHLVHLFLQEHNIVDDDQALALYAYLEKPDWFCMHMLGGFHKALTTFQKE